VSPLSASQHSWKWTTVAVAAALALLTSCTGPASPEANPSSSTSTTAPFTAPSLDMSTAQPLQAALEAGLRGLFSPESFWDQTFTAATSVDCTAQGEESMWAQRVWRLPGGGLACTAGNQTPQWGRIIIVKLYFDPHVDTKTALAAVTSILPADSQQVMSKEGVNRDDSKYRDGSCQLLAYSSDTLAAAVRQVRPKWPEDPHLVSVELYTGNQTNDGADRPYHPDSVHLADLRVGSPGSNPLC
jgi:hypothetical protein